MAKEKLRQAPLKSDPSLFSEAAREDGAYSLPSAKTPSPPTYPFCLPTTSAVENLFFGVREQVESFAKKRIPWHKGMDGGPTTHLCSSQVCCVNFLGAFAHNPDALLSIVRPWYPEAIRMVPVGPKVEDDLVEFEWIGDPGINYLDEAGKLAGKRTRGANCTSADAAVKYLDASGAGHVVLIEWKYCESYRDLSKIPEAQKLLSKMDGVLTNAAETRRGRYEKRLKAMAELPDGVTFADLCVEPLYQLLRQQLLAYEMEAAGEGTSVSVLHLSPRANLDFPRITSPAVRGWAAREFPGEEPDVTEAWLRLGAPEARFRHAAIEDFFAPSLAGTDPSLDSWRAYVTKRYSWVTG